MKVLCVTTAVALSLAVHVTLPLLGRLVADRQALSTLELFAYAPPELLPVDVINKEGPAAAPEPEGPESDREELAPSGHEDALADADETAIEDEAPPAPPAEPTPPAHEERPPPVQSAPPAAREDAPQRVQPDRPRTSRSRVADLRARRHRNAQRIAELRRRAAERSARAGAAGESRQGKGGKGGGEGGGTARAEAKQGDPESVYACTKDGIGKKVDVRFDRPINDWVTVVPTVLMPFEARPSLGDYLEGVSQVVSRRRGGVERAGPVEFALPASVLQMNVDEPRGVRVAIGHLEGRCLVGLKYTKELFPLTLSKVPVRVVDHANRSANALVNITLYKNASFDLEVIDGALPFDDGMLANAKNISETIEQHYAAARAFKEVAGWFGFDIAKMARDARVERAKGRASQAKANKRGKVVRRDRD